MIDKLLWLDLETTGLEPGLDKIIELAAIVTEGPEFIEGHKIEILVNLEEDAEARLKAARVFDWSSGKPEDTGQTVYDMHKKNGLIERIGQSGVSREEAEGQICAFVEDHFSDSAYLAGNSIHQDRRFIREEMPLFEKLLHYRMLDVSSFKIVMQMNGVAPYHKEKSHRAIDDIRESIAELKYYQSRASGE